MQSQISRSLAYAHRTRNEERRRDANPPRERCHSPPRRLESGFNSFSPAEASMKGLQPFLAPTGGPGAHRAEGEEGAVEREKHGGIRPATPSSSEACRGCRHWNTQTHTPYLAGWRRKASGARRGGGRAPPARATHKPDGWREPQEPTAPSSRPPVWVLRAPAGLPCKGGDSHLARLTARRVPASGPGPDYYRRARGEAAFSSSSRASSLASIRLPPAPQVSPPPARHSPRQAARSRGAKVSRGWSRLGRGWLASGSTSAHLLLLLSASLPGA